MYSFSLKDILLLNGTWTERIYTRKLKQHKEEEEEEEKNGFLAILSQTFSFINMPSSSFNLSSTVATVLAV